MRNKIIEVIFWFSTMDMNPDEDSSSDDSFDSDDAVWGEKFILNGNKPTPI